MSAQAVDAKQIHIEELLDAVENGTAALPAFQRDFDWSSPDVVSLLATLLSDWPAGSLLLMSGRPEFFEIRGFRDGPELAANVRYVVLDGQQRLTALFHALRGRGDDVFVLNGHELAKSRGTATAEEIEELIEVIPASKWRREYPIQRQSHEGLIPLHELRTASDFFAWRDRMIDAAPERERAEVGKLLADIYRSHLGRLHRYAFPSVLLDNVLPPAAVARIFERINLTGLRMNAFDLLVARVYEPEWNLRERWETARRESEPIAHWLSEEEGLSIIQAISLEVEGDVRQPALLSLKARDIRNTWDNAVTATESAILKLRRIGVPSPSWMPYRGLLLPLANRALRLGSTALEDRGELATWFWARSFGMEYGVGSSTRIAFDSRLLALPEPDWWSTSFQIDRRILQSSTRRKQSALWSAFLSLLSAQTPRDLLSGEAIENPADDAVPVSLFARGEGDLHLRVLGMVLLTRPSAQLLRKDRRAFLAHVNFASLSSQLLPEGRLLESLSDPDEFIHERVRMVEGSINRISDLRIEWFDGRDA